MRALLVLLMMLSLVGDVWSAEIKLVATGDIMAHMGNIKAAKTAYGYNFEQFFAPEVVKVLRDGDLVIGNFETRLAGKERRYTGYPAFNAPDELAQDLKIVGFNFLTTANNHVLDRGAAGIERTNVLLSTLVIGNTGSFATPQAAEKITVKRINGVDVAILAYTYGTNGIPLPRGREYMVNIIDESKIISDIKKALAISEFIIVSLHWGDEYALKENKGQIELAKILHKAGADLIIGHHPHVVQGMQDFTQAGQAKKLTFYSLGNFISGQTKKNTDRGYILRATISKNDNEAKARLVDYELVKTIVKRPVRNGIRSYSVEILK